MPGSRNLDADSSEVGSDEVVPWRMLETPTWRKQRAKDKNFIKGIRNVTKSFLPVRIKFLWSVSEEPCHPSGWLLWELQLQWFFCEQVGAVV